MNMAASALPCHRPPLLHGSVKNCLCCLCSLQALDLFIAGFTCKIFSSESTTRYTARSVKDMFVVDGVLVPWILAMVLLLLLLLYCCRRGGRTRNCCADRPRPGKTRHPLCGGIALREANPPIETLLQKLAELPGALFYMWLEGQAMLLPNLSCCRSQVSRCSKT